MSETFAGVAALCALLFVFPYVIYPLTLRLLPKKPLRLREVESDGSGFALFFCAYNEAKVMSEKLANVRELRARYPELRVCAFDDASTDGTRQILESEPDLVTVVHSSERAGKAHGMKRMVRECAAEYLVFTDANVLLDLDCIRELANYYSDPSVGGVCGSLNYRSSDQSSTTEAAGGLYWKLEEWTKGLESETGNVMGADGSIFSVRRSLYPEFPDTVQDDFTVSMSVVIAGSRLVRAKSVVAYERLVADRRDEARRKVRIAARALHTHATLRPRLKQMALVDRYKYVSHKVLRWWGAVPIAVGAVAASLTAISFGLAGILVVFAAVAACLVARAFRPKPFGFLADLLTAVLATFWGALKGRCGETFTVWTPPETR